MSTFIAIIIIIAVLGMLISYYLGYSAGRREGYDSGKRDGKREGSVRAYAVGFDRGRHERETRDESSAKVRKPIGCLLICAILIMSLLTIPMVLIATLLRSPEQNGPFSPQWSMIDDTLPMRIDGNRDSLQRPSEHHDIQADEKLSLR